MLDRTQVPPSSPVVYEDFPHAESIRLNTGINAFWLSSGSQPIIKLELRLKSGIWYENVPALSWLTAKMLMEGTSTKDARTLQDSFDRLGAFIEIDAGFDFVTFSIHGIRKNFNEVLILISEVLNDPVFHEKEFQILKDLRINDLKLNDAKNNMFASKKIRSIFFGEKHPYGRILKSEDVENTTLDEVKDYYKNSLFNQPELFVSGQVDQSLMAQIDETLRIPASNIIVRPSSDRSPIKALNIDRPDSLQSSVRMAWACPHKSDPEYHDFSIANAILGGYFGSRLMKNIREEKGYSYGISSYPVHFLKDSFCIIGTDIKAEFTQATVEAIKDEISGLQTHGATENEIQSVTNYLAGKFQSSISNPFKIMGKFKLIHDAGFSYEFYEDFFKALSNFNSDKLMEMVQKYFDLNYAHLVIVGKTN